MMSATIHITAKFGPPGRQKNKAKDKAATAVSICKNANESPADYNTRVILTLCRNYLNGFVPMSLLFRDCIDPNAHTINISQTQRTSSKKMHWATMTPVDIADFATLTETYIKPILYQETLTYIRKELDGHLLFASISTSGRFNEEYNFVNVIVGTYTSHEGGGGKVKRNKLYLVNCKEVRVTDPSGQEEGESKEFYLDLFLEAMKLLWPHDPSAWTRHILQLNTEPLDGMFHAALEIKSLHPNLIHVTCMNRTLHLLEQLIILPSEDIAPYHNHCPVTFQILLDFHQHLNIIGRPTFCKLSKIPEMPPDSFGPLDNLLDWVDYVHKHFDALKSYLRSTDTFWGRDELLELFETPDVRRNLATMKVKYASFGSARSLLATRQELVPLEAAVEAVDAFHSKVSKWPDQFEKKLMEKYDELLSINDGYRELEAFSRGDSGLLDRVDPTHRELLHHAPITALTREQCFPRFEQLLKLFPDFPLPPESLAIYAVIYCAKEQQYRHSGYDEKKVYCQLNYRQEMYNKGLKLKEVMPASAVVPVSM